MHRRSFIAISSAACASGFSADSTSARSAAVIGHTGRGDYGHGLEKIFAGRSHIEVVAVADPDEAGRSAAAAASGAKRQYADYREMLSKEKPALVSVALRHADQHHDIIMAALQSGAHVYCEKPFVRWPAEGDALLAEADRRGLKIAVAHTQLQTPAARQLQQALQEGVIGELRAMHAWGKQDSRAGGEDLMVLGSHLMDLLRLFGGDPLWCSARVLTGGRDITKTDGRQVKDNIGPVAGDEVFAQYAFPRGVNATFTSSARLRATLGSWGIDLIGDKGTARFDCEASPHAFVRESTGWQKSVRTDTLRAFDPGALKSPAVPALNAVDDWLQSIAANREPACSGRRGLWAVEMVLAVYHAALSGSRVAFPLKDRNHPLAG